MFSVYEPEPQVGGFGQGEAHLAWRFYSQHMAHLDLAAPCLLESVILTYFLGGKLRKLYDCKARHFLSLIIEKSFLKMPGLCW